MLGSDMYHDKKWIRIIGIGRWIGVTILKNMVVRQCLSKLVIFKHRCEGCERAWGYLKKEGHRRRTATAQSLRQDCAWCVPEKQRFPWGWSQVNQNESQRKNEARLFRVFNAMAEVFVRTALIDKKDKSHSLMH